jgi:MFS family permease/quinol monooxygenase YgiN
MACGAVGRRDVASDVLVAVGDMESDPSEGGGRSRTAAEASKTAPPTGLTSAWAPLRYYPIFRALWIAQFVSNVGTWMQTVGAQWLLVDHSALLVSLVQTASSLPILALALPAGAWADLVDRRRLLLGAQIGMFLAAAALAGVTFLGVASPSVILTLTLLLGCGNAVALPAWQAIQPDLVDRTVLPQAAALNGVNMNLARAVGPALGGVVVAAAGAGWVFALNAVSFVGIAAVVASWRAPEPVDMGSRERLVEALWAGGRYVRHSRVVRRLLYRALLYIPAASAVWALLPVVAARNLGLGSGGYGLLLGMVGIGAVGGALVIPWLRARLGSAALVTGATVVTAAAMSLVATVNNAVLVSVALLPIGGAWIAVMSSLNAGLQLALPNWVRARALAYHLAVFQGALGGGAVIWGTIADGTTVTTALLVAAATLVVGGLFGLRTPMPETSKLDRTPSAHWPAPQLMFTPNAGDGPVLITVTYKVPQENAVAFTEAMRNVGRSRRRTGALRWELFRDGNDPTRFVESYLVGTWAEHLRQHEHRLTGADRKIEEEALRYAASEPEIAHLFPPPASDPTKR